MQSNEQVNILLVDDHPENILALEAILESLGENLVKAYSGEEALKHILRQDFAVILLDVQMPGIDGFETAALIRQRQSSRYTPIIFLTAFSKSDALVSKGYSLGAVDYLLKPIEPEILKSKVVVFVDLFKKTAEIKQQAAELEAVNAELSKSEERFRSLSACSPVGIFLTDVEGICTYTNPRCEAISGFKVKESLEESWRRSLHPEDQKVLADWSEFTLQGKEYSNEFRLITASGIVRWVHVRSSPMLSGRGKFIGSVGTIEDISEAKRDEVVRKQAEEERAQLIREQEARQQAEAANQTKDEFLAILSHELRTPLNSILGWTQLLRTRKFDETTMHRALETMERNAKSQSQLIEDILDISRIVQGKLRLNFRSIKLEPVIEAAINTVRPLANDKGIELEIILGSTLQQAENLHSPLLISGDPDRLQQVVWNLLTNAIKFTPKGGKVEVRLDYVDSHAQIKVIDTGIGISQDFLPYVFDHFRQANGTTTRLHNGLGLGLAIARNLVELHGGTIHADSNGNGQGTTFTVCLVLLEGTKEVEIETQEAPPEISSPSPLIDLKILIVDDDHDTRDFLTTVLEEHGANVMAVASAAKALEALPQLKPDLIVSDIGMPQEDGYSLISKVRAWEKQHGGNIPAIALSAYTTDKVRQQALQAGFQMHLHKPIEPAKLVAIVAKLAKPNC